MKNDTLNPGEIGTFTGKRIKILELKPKDIDIRDIAHSLAYQCRFAGHTQKFYSVAEHSFMVWKQCVFKGIDKSRKDQLAFLLHDGAETYFQDLMKPIKTLCPIYALAEKNAQLVVFRKFGITNPPTEEIKLIDQEICKRERTEARDSWSGYFHGWEPARAEANFLETFRQLTC
jgi:5'-deoxynucleotidase YfbR-like HD superfamily hydrolase